MVNAIGAIYANSKSRVRIGDALSDFFLITTGVLQGDTLAPFLFVIVLDHVLKQIDPNHGIRTHFPESDICLPDLVFADDIVIFDSNEYNAGEHITNIRESAASVGLKMNEEKTKIMLQNYQFGPHSPQSLENFEVVDDFRYLGSQIASSYKDFRRRCGIAWDQFWKLEKV